MSNFRGPRNNICYSGHVKYFSDWLIDWLKWRKSAFFAVFTHPSLVWSPRNGSSPVTQCICHFVYLFIWNNTRVPGLPDGETHVIIWAWCLQMVPTSEHRLFYMNTEIFSIKPVKYRHRIFTRSLQGLRKCPPSASTQDDSWRHSWLTASFTD